MSNVIHLSAASRRPGPFRPTALAALTAIAARVAQIGEMEMDSKEDLQEAILLLGLSNLRARQLISEIGDDETRSRLMAHLERIGELVEIARRKAEVL